MSIEQEKMLLDRLHTKILKNKIAEIITQDEVNALVNAKYRITKVKPKFNENIGVYYCPDCERHLAVNYDLHCSGCGLPIDYSDFASSNLKLNLAEKIADFVINNWHTCPIQESDFICPSGFKKEGCRECFMKYVESLN